MITAIIQFAQAGYPDHPEIIDKTGKVTRPEKDTMVKLTVKTYYSASFVEETDSS